jgi:peptide deformylase
VVTPLGADRINWWEGCLSVPGLRGFVRRPRRVRVRALDIHGKALSFAAEGFEAVVIQHEADHLDGILYPERMTDLKKLVFEHEYNRFHESANDKTTEDACDG